MAGPYLVTATLPNEDSAPKDEIRFGWVLTAHSVPTGADVGAVPQEFFNVTGAGASTNIGEKLASCVSRTATLVAAAYDLSGHLDGSPHGSPIATGTFTIGPAVSDSRGNAQCAVIGYTSAAYDSTPISGPTAAIPTPESAQDMGAPATHLGVEKLRARQGGRIFLGPIAGDCIGVDGNANAVLTDTTVNDLAADVHAFADGVGGVGPTAPWTAWCVWSRRNAAVAVVAGGWVDKGIKIRRHKNFVPGTRTAWSV